MLAIFLLGFILDFIEITYVVIPVVAPILLSMGLDPIWLGILIAINLQTSFLTPPFGFAIFYLKSVIPKEVETVDIYKGVIPFIIIQMIVLIGNGNTTIIIHLYLKICFNIFRILRLSL